MLRLQERLTQCQKSLQNQTSSVSEISRDAQELQTQAAALRQAVEQMDQRLKALGVGAAQIQPPRPATVEPALPTPQPVAAPLPYNQASSPSQQFLLAAATPDPKETPLPGTAMPDKGHPGVVMQAMPYIVLAAAGMGYVLTSHASSAAIADPIPAVAPAANNAAEGPENEALRLVYEYRLPGTDSDILNLVGDKEGILGPSPWDIDCPSHDRCSVVFNVQEASGRKPVYEFEADLLTKTVSPSPETAAKLAAATPIEG